MDYKTVSKDYVGTAGGDEQMFGVNQQVPHAGGCYKERKTAVRRNSSRTGQVGEPRCGVSTAGLLPPFGGARRALKLNMSWHHPELYFFLSLLAGYAALLVITYEGIQKFLRNRFRPRFTPGGVQRLEQRSHPRL